MLRTAPLLTVWFVPATSVRPARTLITWTVKASVRVVAMQTVKSALKTGALNVRLTTSSSRYHRFASPVHRSIVSIAHQMGIVLAAFQVIIQSRTASRYKFVLPAPRIA